MGDINSVKAHIIEKIFLSKLITNPFDHKYVSDIFPLEFFNTLLENIPEKSNYTPIIKTGTVSNDYSPERFIFNLLESDDIEKLSQERKHFFNDFNCSKDQTLKKFSEVKKIKFYLIEATLYSL